MHVMTPDTSWTPLAGGLTEHFLLANADLKTLWRSLGWYTRSGLEPPRSQSLHGDAGCRAIQWSLMISASI